MAIFDSKDYVIICDEAAFRKIACMHKSRNRPWCSNDVCGASLQLLSRMAPPHSRHRASFAILRIAALSAQEAYDLALTTRRVMQSEVDQVTVPTIF